MSEYRSASSDPWADYSLDDLLRLADDPAIRPQLMRALYDSPSAERMLDEGPTREDLIALLSRFCCPVASNSFELGLIRFGGQVDYAVLPSVSLPSYH